MTQDEFVQYYAANSQCSPEELTRLGLFPMPCACGDATCQGWRMTNAERERP